MKQSEKFWRWIIILLVGWALTGPAVFALESDEDKSRPAYLLYQGGDGEEGDGQADAAGFVLTLLMGVIGLIIAVVAILGAVSLGIIGIGYASVSPDEE